MTSQLPLQAVATLLSLGLVALVVRLIRRRRLKEELWAPWLLATLGPLLCSMWLEPWTRLARWLGIRYEPALLMLVGIFFALGLLLYLTVVISGLMRQSQQLAQDVAQLTWRLERMERGAS